MTMTTDRAAARRSGTRLSGRGSARARAGEHLSHADRAALGKDARAMTPLESQAEFEPEPGAGSGRAAARRRRSRGCPSWCRSGTAGCWSRRSPSTGARRCRWPPTWPARRRPGCGSSCAGTRTCRTSVRSPRRSGAWSSTSTTSTRRCLVRSSGTSSGWPRAWPSPGGTTASRPRRAAGSSLAAAEAYRTAMRRFAEQPLLDCLVRAPRHRGRHRASFRSQMKAKRVKAAEGLLAKAHTTTARRR